MSLKRGKLKFNTLLKENIKEVKIILGFLKKFYNFKTNITNFLNIKATKSAFILAFIKHFLNITQNQAINILNIKVKLYYLILANFILEAKNNKLKFLDFL